MATSKLQFKAAELIIRIQLVKKASKPIVKTVINSVDEIFNTIFELLEDKFTRQCGEDGALNLSEILNIVKTFRGFSLFEEVNSDGKLETFLKNEYSYVPPVKEVLLSASVVQGTKTEEIDIDYGYYVPFLPSLEQVLSCPEILHCVNNPRPVKDGVFTSPLDAYYYQNHPVVQADQHTLAINTYTDGVGMTDTAGSKSTKHSVTFIYWSLLNVYPEMRSTEDAVFLLGAANSSVIKKWGFDKLLEDFVQGMKSLFSGVDLRIGNDSRFFHGILVFNSADTPAAANLAGFKESHFAEKVCRQCLVPKQDLYKTCDESSFPPRSYISHAQQVEEVENFRRTKDDKNDPSVTYGINRRSVFMEIPMCDVTKCFPQDLMHVTIEGTLKLEMCLLISHALASGKISLAKVNARIAKYSKHFGVNKPAPISRDHLDNKTLHQTATETLNLAYMLPFVLRKKNMRKGVMETVCDKKNLKCFILRLELLDLLMSRVLTVDDVEKIRKLIKEHHELFVQIYPGVFIPKMHFEFHYATQVLLFGPLVQQWCFRFESKHSYFKKLYRMLRSVKDLVGTLSRNHQRHQSAMMMLSAKGYQGPYLSKSNSYGVPVLKLLKNIPPGHQQLLPQVFEEICSNSTIKVFKTCSLNGVRYRKKSMIICQFTDTLPMFGEVEAIYGHGNQDAFIIKRMKTYQYEEDLKSFKVGYLLGSDRFSVIRLSDLVHHHHLYVIKTTTAVYVSVPRKSFK